MKLVKLARRGGEPIWVNPEYVVRVGWDYCHRGGGARKLEKDGAVIRTTVDKEDISLWGDPVSVVAALQGET